MLKLGSSKKWPEALERVTGTRTMSAQPILLFFQKLHDWLKEENSGHDITWEDGCPQGSVVGPPYNDAVSATPSLIIMTVFLLGTWLFKRT